MAQKRKQDVDLLGEVYASYVSWFYFFSVCFWRICTTLPFKCCTERKMRIFLTKPDMRVCLAPRGVDVVSNIARNVFFVFVDVMQLLQ